MNSGSANIYEVLREYSWNIHKMGIETFWYAAPIFEKPDKCPDWCAISAKNAGLVPAPYILTCSRRMFRAAGTRMPWHPVPSRAASAELAVRLV